jgi:hypothetical protein
MIDSHLPSTLFVMVSNQLEVVGEYAEAFPHFIAGISPVVVKHKVLESIPVFASGGGSKSTSGRKRENE